jgi:predicted phosphodiesterase
MRYGLLADIHSNLPALESVLEELAHRGVDGYLCLGDVVGYGAFPNECCELLRSLNALVVRGNHDEAAVRPPGAASSGRGKCLRTSIGLFWLAWSRCRY